uniref:Ovule protein n=1 Tax=Syphacia muris TaxID=451379 RepID=A0A0N5B186_9BILA
MSFNQLHQSLKYQVGNLQHFSVHNSQLSAAAKNDYSNNAIDNFDYGTNDESATDIHPEKTYLKHNVDEDCATFPNYTDIAPHFFSCSSQSPSLLQIHDAAITNATGDDHFPVDFSQKIRFFFDVTSSVKRRYAFLLTFN